MQCQAAPRRLVDCEPPRDRIPAARSTQAVATGREHVWGIFALPLVPMDGREVAHAIAIVTDVIERDHRLVPQITLNGVGRVFEMVLT